MQPYRTAQVPDRPAPEPSPVISTIGFWAYVFGLLGLFFWLVTWPVSFLIVVVFCIGLTLFGALLGG